MNDVTRLTKAVATVLTHAEAHDLPIPARVEITYAGIDFMVVTETELSAWSVYLDEPIESHRHTGDHRLAHHQVRGDALEQPIKVWTTSAYCPAAGSLAEAFDRLADGVTA